MDQASARRIGTQRGCTLFESLLLLAIITVIYTGLGICAYTCLQRGRRAATLHAMRATEAAVVRWQDRGDGRCPPSVAALARAGLLSREPLDGWRRPVRLARCDAGGVALYSTGADGVAQTRDDILSWAATDRRWVREAPPRPLPARRVALGLGALAVLVLVVRALRRVPLTFLGAPAQP